MQALCLLSLSVPASAQGGDPPTYKHWILAEGAANDFFDEEIVIGNPNAQDATVHIKLLPQFATPIIVDPIIVKKTSRFTFNVRSKLPLGASVSAVVDSNQPVVVERTMTWAQGRRRGGHNSPGLLATAPTWYLTEGVIGFFETFILITNPDPNTDAQIEVKYLQEFSPPLSETMVVPKNGRVTIYANEGLDLNHDGVRETFFSEPFSTVITSTNGVNIAVERAMYWGGFEGGHESAAVTAPDKVWLFSEGNTGGDASFFWETWLLLANPQNVEAHVKMTFFRLIGGPLTHEFTLAKNARKTMNIGGLDVDGDGTPDLRFDSFSTRIESDVPILAERSMYWSSSGIRYIDGHNTPGANAEALKWAFAEGAEGSIDATGVGYDSFFLVSNATEGPLALKATFVREDGKGLVVPFTVAPKSRFTLPTASFPELSHQRFSAFLESTNGVPFVAERAVYWGPGFFGGHASVGTPWDAEIGVPPIVNLTPTVASLSPNKGLTTGGTDVTIDGTNFIEPLGGSDGTRVTFGPVRATAVRIISDTRLIARTPPMAQPGAVTVTVSNAHINPAWTAVNVPNGFTYNPVEPLLTTDFTLAFGDSITAGSTSRFCDAGGTSLICSGFTTGYPERLRALLRLRYPKQPEIDVTNAGSPGECVSRSGCTGISGGRRFLDLLPGAHDLAVILEGVNDVNGDFPIGDIIGALRLMIDSARAQGKQVILSSLTPVKAPENTPGEQPDFWKTNPFRIASLNAAIDQLAAEMQVPRVNMVAAFGSGSGPLDCNASSTCRAFLSPDGLHPNDLGYQRMADVIFARIVESFEAR